MRSLHAGCTKPVAGLGTAGDEIHVDEERSLCAFVQGFPLRTVRELRCFGMQHCDCIQQSLSLFFLQGGVQHQSLSLSAATGAQ